MIRRPANHARPGETGVARESSTRSLLRAVGRFALWAFLVLALVRGVGAMLDGPEDRTLASASPGATSANSTALAEAFAADFARAYLSFDPRDPEAYTAGVEPYLADGVNPNDVSELPDSGSAQIVTAAEIAGRTAVDDQRSLVTVQTRVESGDANGRTVFLSVPVATSAGGDTLAVYDLPSIAPAPRLGRATTEATSPVASADADEVHSLLERFFATYLADRSADLSFFVPPDRRVDSPGSRFELVSLDSVEQVGAGEGPRRVVLASLRARDPVSGATYGLRYRVGLERRDRWYVAELNTDEGGS